MSRADLASFLGVDPRQIQRYETGDSQPTLQGARLLAERLGVTLDELAGGPPALGGLWWSHWEGLDHDVDHTGPVELTHRGKRVEVTPASDPNLEPGLAWRAEMLADPDYLLGWYVIDDPSARSRGTITLRPEAETLAGNWVQVSLSGLKAGSLALARTPEAARDRLTEITQAESKDRH